MTRFLRWAAVGAWRLVRDLGRSSRGRAEGESNALARDDDVLDAWLDDDGMDATGL